MVFNENLKKVRRAAGYTGAQVAQMVGINDSAYRNYEAGEREMPLKVQEAVADALGVELSLLYEEDTTILNNMLVCAFRVEDLSENDNKELIAFKRIVKNYMKMDRLLQA